jgi:phosphomannomutase/phosphoglucomutase
MKEDQIPLSGEMSGHMFFGKDYDYYGFDDAVFSALKVLEYLSEQNRPLSQILEEIPHYISTPVINVEAPDETKHETVKKLVEEFKNEGYRVVDVDGARVYTEDGWGLVRASNTTPNLVLRFEAKSKEGIGKLEQIFKEKLAQFKSVGQDWSVKG